MALTRTRHQMPDYIRAALTERKLMDAYQGRPEYQQKDQIGSPCVTRAQREETRQKRLARTPWHRTPGQVCPGCRRRGMLDELDGGKLYINLSWTKSRTLFNRR